jgi:SAM-dependent methyltransferase
MTAAPEPAPRTTHAPMQSSKLENYNSPRGAEAYKSDYRKKLHRRVSDRRERAILDRYLAIVGKCNKVLDLPCGHGRLSDLLYEHTQQLIEADWSFTMVALNRQDHGDERRRYFRASALEIPLPDRSVDLVVSFRLNHHLETDALRELHLRELFRVAGRAVIVTWFSHTSLKAVLRRFRGRFTGKRGKHTLRNARAVELAKAAGFLQRAATPLFRIGSGHMVALFTRA